MLKNSSSIGLHSPVPLLNARTWTVVGWEKKIGSVTCAPPPLKVETCAAGLAAIRAYEDEKLIERSRRFGSAMLLELKRLQQQHRMIGDVRGGHGLFAIIELVSDSVSRAPLAPWPENRTRPLRSIRMNVGNDVTLNAERSGQASPRAPGQSAAVY